MDLPDAVTHCLSFPGTEESTPFGPEALVYKVAGKMFALAIPDDVPPRLNLKCDPDRALALRDEHPAILPGYHMNKRHWNTVVLDGSLPPSLVRSLIDHSYSLVVAALPKSAQQILSQAAPTRVRPTPKKQA
jgi:predicted DNA-binding protein (MmcQ/YjbR family)